MYVQCVHTVENVCTFVGGVTSCVGGQQDYSGHLYEEIELISVEALLHLLYLDCHGE